MHSNYDHNTDFKQSSLNAFSKQAFEKKLPQHLPQTGSKHAGFWLRFGAYILDYGITLMLSFPLFILLAYFVVPEPPETNPSLDLSGFYILAYFLVSALYSSLMVSSYHQATLGKKALGIIIVSEKGHKLNFGHALGRYLLKSIGGQIPLAYLLCAFTPEKQALHDFLAQTFVVQKN